MGQSFDGKNVASRTCDSQREARQDALSIDDHSARAASALITALLRAWQLESLADGIKEGDTRVKIGPTFNSVYAQLYEVCEFRLVWVRHHPLLGPLAEDYSRGHILAPNPP
jgi:hypothetical protein